MNGNKDIFLSIIILNMNEHEDTHKCLDSIHSYVNSEYEIIIIDNGSTDDELQKLSSSINSFPIDFVKKINLIKLENNIGVGPGRNHGASKSNGKFLLFIDNDAFFDEKIDLSRIFFREKLLDLHGYGQVSFQLTNLDGTRQFNQRRIPSFLHPFYARLLPQQTVQKYINNVEYRDIIFSKNSLEEVDWSIGAFQIFNKETFYKLGRFDDTLIYGHEDLEIALSAKKSNLKNATLNHKKIKHVYKRRQRKINSTTIKWLLFFYKIMINHYFLKLYGKFK